MKSAFLSYEYVQFLNEKVLEFLPHNYVRVGDKLNMRCPVCGDSRKSATKRRGWYYLKNASFYCFNCSTGMSGMKFLELISGSKYEELKKEYFRMCFRNGVSTSLSSHYDVPNEEPTVFQLQSIVKPEWKQPLSDKAKAYLNGRRVLDAPFLRDPLYSCYTKSSEEYIMIPWRLNGVDAYYQLNDFQKLHSLKYIFPKDKKKLIAGLDNIDLSWPYIIVFEGFYDSVFVKNGICVGTKSVTEYQLELIRDRYPKHQIVIAFDNDAPGLQSVAKLLKESNDYRYFKWFGPETKQKDINEIVLAKNDVNMFADQAALEKMVVDKLLMKMYLIQNGCWSR